MGINEIVDDAYNTGSRTYAIFAGSFCKGDVDKIIVQVAYLILSESRKTAARVLEA